MLYLMQDIVEMGCIKKDFAICHGARFILILDAKNLKLHYLAVKTWDTGLYFCCVRHKSIGIVRMLQVI
jgi:hypothetical protein